MLNVLFDLACVAVAFAIALLLGLLAMRRVWRSNPKNTAALASALMLFLSPGYIDRRREDLAEETGDEIKRKKDSRLGDPPIAGRTFSEP
jgi:hypothetical protein